MRALSTAIPATRRLLRSDGLQRWYVHEPTGPQGQALVIKQLAPSSAVDASLLERWLAAAARNLELKHPGCTQVQDFGMHEGKAYVVSASPCGISLRSLLDAVQASGARLATQLVAPIGIMILEALDYAQQRDPTLTHLDLDLEAVTVRSDGSLVLSEFALWSVLSPVEIARCRFDSGRVQYCAPELVQSGPTDCRSDIFSVGGLLYQLLTGECPFAGATQLLIALAIADGQRASVQARAPEAPPHLCEVVEVMLTTSAGERFQTPAAAATALRSTVSFRDRRGDALADASSLHGVAAEVVTQMFAGVRLPASPAPIQTRPVGAQSVALLTAHGKPSTAPPLHPHAAEARVPTREPAPPPIWSPACASAPPVPPDFEPGPVRTAELRSSDEQLPSGGSHDPARMAVNDGRTAHLRAPDRLPDPDREHRSRECIQPPLLLPSATRAGSLLAPPRELVLSPSLFRSGADEPRASCSRPQAGELLAPSWSPLAKHDDRWSDPSDTVFQHKVSASTSPARAASVCARDPSAREQKRSHLWALSPMSMGFGFVAAVALYLVYRLLS